MSAVRRLAALCLTLAVLAGCGGDNPEPEPSRSSETSTSSETPTTSAEPTDTGQGGPDEQAAAQDALAAYNAAWDLVVLARRDPGAKPDWSLDYGQFYGEPLLSQVLGTLYGMRDDGLANPSGAPIRQPEAGAVDLASGSVAIKDCVDVAQWPQIYVATGESNSVPQPPYLLEAQVVYSQADGRWLVVEQVADPNRPCE